MNNFRGRGVKSQGQTTPKLKLAAWRRHHNIILDLFGRVGLRVVACVCLSAELQENT